MGHHFDEDYEHVTRETLILQESVVKAERLFEYTRYGLVILDCLLRRSEVNGFRSLGETAELHLFSEQLNLISVIADGALRRRWFFGRKNTITYLSHIYTLISRQMGLVLMRPITLRSRGYYHPSLSACQLCFRYGTETFVFRGEDFENSTVKMVKLDLNLVPEDVCLKVQQGYFKTAVFPLESVKLNTMYNRAWCRKTDHERYVSELELKFPIDFQGDSGEIIVRLDIRWLYHRRPFFLGNRDPLKDPNFRVANTLCSPNARHV